MSHQKRPTFHLTCCFLAEICFQTGTRHIKSSYTIFSPSLCKSPSAFFPAKCPRRQMKATLWPHPVVGINIKAFGWMSTQWLFKLQQVASTTDAGIDELWHRSPVTVCASCGVGLNGCDHAVEIWVQCVVYRHRWRPFLRPVCTGSLWCAGPAAASQQAANQWEC